MKPVLFDTGPIVASLDADDSHHRFVMDGLAIQAGRAVTTGAVITEAMFFLQDIPGGSTCFVDWIHRLGVEIIDCFTPGLLSHAAALMSRYADTPMDFADATLVCAAEQMNCGDILTLDVRGFRTYRYNKNKRFKLLLQDG